MFLTVTNETQARSVFLWTWLILASVVLLHFAVDFTAPLLWLQVVLKWFEMHMKRFAAEIKEGEAVFTYSVFLAPAWLPEGWHWGIRDLLCRWPPLHHHSGPLGSPVCCWQWMSCDLHPLLLNILHLKIKYEF